MGQPAARIGDMHICPMPGKPPHVGGPVLTGEATVLIGGEPAARKGDKAHCNGSKDTITQGERTVLIGGQPAARQGDKTAHGGMITIGCPTVLIGKNEGECLAEAAKSAAMIVHAMGDV